MLVLLITGCGKAASGAATTAPTFAEVPTSAPQPTEPDFIGVVDQLLQEDCVVVEGKTWEECEAIVREQGFAEFRTDLVNNLIYRKKQYVPHTLRYNDRCFCLQFDYYNYDIDASGASPAVETRTLYGLKDASAEENISSYNLDFYEYHQASDVYGASVEYVSAQNLFYYGNTLTGKQEKVYLSQYYYPDSGNLYNLTFDTEDPDYSPASVYILCRYLEEFNKPKETSRVYQMEIVLEDAFQSIYFYQEGMTFQEWLHSDYAKYSGWEEFDNFATFAVTDSYGCLLEGIDRPIQDFLEADGFTIFAEKCFFGAPPPA